MTDETQDRLIHAGILAGDNGDHCETPQRSFRRDGYILNLYRNGEPPTPETFAAGTCGSLVWSIDGWRRTTPACLDAGGEEWVRSGDSSVVARLAFPPLGGHCGCDTCIGLTPIE